MASPEQEQNGAPASPMHGPSARESPKPGADPHEHEEAAQELAAWSGGRLFRSNSHRSTGSHGPSIPSVVDEEGVWIGGRLFRGVSHRSVLSVAETVHSIRLARRSVGLLEERAEALEQHRLAPTPSMKKRAGQPLKELLRNLWVLAIMAGVVAIVVVAKGRIHVPEPLAGVHATDGVVPFVLPLDATSIDYLFMNLVIAPYYPPDEDGSGSGGGHRRRLAAWVGQAVATHDAGGAGPPGGAYVDAQAHADLVRRVRQLLAKPKLALARRSSSGGGGWQQHRRLLVQSDVEEPANEGLVSDLPELKVTLVQHNTSGTPAQQQGFHPVSDSQFCSTKEGAAVKCALSFTGGDLTSEFVEGQALFLSFESTQVTQLVFRVEVSDLGWLGYAKNYIALGILGLVLVGIASERVHRMWCAMIGASAMLGLLLWMNMVPSLGMVVEWLDESTLGLLFGMMIIVGRLKDTGMFELLSAWTVRLSGGRMWLLSTALMIVTAFVSAFLDNVTTILLMAPISISLMRACNVSPIPILLGQVLMSNIGGAATMVGDPPALIIGTALSQYLGFVDFIINMAPGVLMAAAACIPLILYIYRRSLLGRIQDYERVLGEVKDYGITDWNLMAKCSYVTGAVLVGFLLHPVHHVDPAWFAVLGAIVLCVCDQPMEVEHVLHAVEWDMLLFFAAMFAMIEASAEVGMISMVAGWLESAIRAAPEGSRTLVAVQILLWVSAFISALLDNIPYTIVMVPVIEYLAFAGLGLELPTLAWALNFGACFGGNATLIGASANIVTATLAERAGEHISFVSWLKGGVPVTIVSVAMADVWMILRFCL